MVLVTFTHNPADRGVKKERKKEIEKKNKTEFVD